MADYQPHRAEPGQKFGYTTADGTQREIEADSRGLIVAENDEDERVLAGFDLPRGNVTANDRASDSPVVRRIEAAREADDPKPAKTEGGEG